MAKCELKLITPNDAKAVRNFFREFILETEPINQYLINKECKDFRYFARSRTIVDSINEGLSYMFVTETGKIVGIGLVAYKGGSSSENEYITPIVQKVMPFMQVVEAKVQQITNLTESNKEACFRIMGVHPDWTRKGLGKSLLEKVITTLKFLGFTHIKAYCSGAYSTKLFEKCGFETLCSFKYADFSHNGEVVLSPDEPHTHLNFMRLKL